MLRLARHQDNSTVWMSRQQRQPGANRARQWGGAEACVLTSFSYCVDDFLQIAFFIGRGASSGHCLERRGKKIR